MTHQHREEGKLLLYIYACSIYYKVKLEKAPFERIHTHTYSIYVAKKIRSCSKVRSCGHFLW